jgi:hypothetical protein
MMPRQDAGHGQPPSIALLDWYAPPHPQTAWSDAVTTHCATLWPQPADMHHVAPHAYPNRAYVSASRHPPSYTHTHTHPYTDTYTHSISHTNAHTLSLSLSVCVCYCVHRPACLLAHALFVHAGAYSRRHSESVLLVRDRASCRRSYGAFPANARHTHAHAYPHIHRERERDRERVRERCPCACWPAHQYTHIHTCIHTHSWTHMHTPTHTRLSSRTCVRVRGRVQNQLLAPSVRHYNANFVENLNSDVVVSLAFVNDLPMPNLATFFNALVQARRPCSCTEGVHAHRNKRESVCGCVGGWD